MTQRRKDAKSQGRFFDNAFASLRLCVKIFGFRISGFRFPRITCGPVLRWSCVLTIALLLPRSLPAAGVTLITHGFASEGGYPAWVTGMADQVPAAPGFPGTRFTTYRVSVTFLSTEFRVTASRVNGAAPLTTDSGEIFVELDWSSESQKVSSSYPYASTYQVAGAVAQALQQTNLIAELGGHALAELPLHLIGHQRGGSLVAEVARQLGTNGLWVDQVTTLNPHPFNNDGFVDSAGYSDAPAKYTYANVLFADNFWQNISSNFLAGDPGGEPVMGAYVRQLTNLSGGYGNNDSNVHLWYHGTVQTNTPASDNESSITSAERTNWWAPAEAQGQLAGFYYSLIGGGDRLSTNQPLGAGHAAVRGGFNQQWDLGAGISNNRTALETNFGTWPNIIRLNVTGGTAFTQTQTVPVMFYYQYAGASSNATVRIALDADGNPFNTNGSLVFTGAFTNTGPNAIGIANVNLNVSSVAPGTYAVGVSVTDGTRTRYLYAPGMIAITAGAPRPVLSIAQGNGNSFVISISGTPGQMVAIQSSPNLQSWTSLATNTLSGGEWIYTNQPPGNAGAQFYRTQVVP